MVERTGAEAVVKALDSTMLNGKGLTVKINEEPADRSSLLTKPTIAQWPPVYQKALLTNNEVKKKR